MTCLLFFHCCTSVLTGCSDFSISEVWGVAILQQTKDRALFKKVKFFFTIITSKMVLGWFVRCKLLNELL
jgi:hypothetical protein